MSVVGIDPSLTSTAICWGGGLESGLEFHTRTIFSHPVGRNVVERIARYERLTDEIAATVNAAKPSLIAIEGYAYSARGRAALDLPEFGGILRWRLIQLATVYEVAPATLKKFVTGKGNAKKLQLATTLTRRYGVMFDTDDEFDAYALWRLGLTVSGQLQPENQWQREALETVREGGVRTRKADNGFGANVTAATTTASRKARPS